MNFTDWLGFVGVALILLAYILNVTNKASNTSYTFILLNFFGASIACVASILLKYLPFVILEGIWAVISLVSFMNKFKRQNS